MRSQWKTINWLSPTKIRRYEKIYQKSLELNVLDANDVTSLEAFDARIRGDERVVDQSVWDNLVVEDNKLTRKPS